MSWSEIKKAVNSDLETPLNELITSRTPKGISTSFSAKTELTTMADISGKGFINAFSFAGAINTSSQSSYPYLDFILNIDGEDLVNISYSATSSVTASVDLAFIPPGLTRVSSASSANGIYYQLYFTNDSTDTQCFTTTLPVSISEELSSSTVYRYIVPLFAPIYFSEGFSLQARGYKNGVQLYYDLIE